MTENGLPIKIGTIESIRDYAKLLNKGEKQLLLTEDGLAFISDGVGGAVTVDNFVVNQLEFSINDVATAGPFKKIIPKQYNNYEIRNINVLEKYQEGENTYWKLAEHDDYDIVFLTPTTAELRLYHDGDYKLNY